MPYTVHVPVSSLTEDVRDNVRVHTLTATVPLDIWHDARVSVQWDTIDARFFNPVAEIYAHRNAEDTIDLSDGVVVNIYRVNPQPANAFARFVKSVIGWIPSMWYAYSTDNYNFETGAWE